MKIKSCKNIFDNRHKEYRLANQLEDELIAKFREKMSHQHPWGPIDDWNSELIENRGSWTAKNRLTNQVFTESLGLIGDYSKKDNRIEWGEIFTSDEIKKIDADFVEVTYAVNSVEHYRRFGDNESARIRALELMLKDGLSLRQAKKLLADIRPELIEFAEKHFDSEQTIKYAFSPEHGDQDLGQKKTLRSKSGMWRFMLPDLSNQEHEFGRDLIFAIKRTRLFYCPTSEMISLISKNIAALGFRENEFFEGSFILAYQPQDAPDSLRFVKVPVFKMLMLRRSSPAICEYARYGLLTNRSMEWIFLKDDFIQVLKDSWIEVFGGTPTMIWLTEDSCDGEHIFVHKQDYGRGKYGDVAALKPAWSTPRKGLFESVPNHVRLANHKASSFEDASEERFMLQSFVNVHSKMLDNFKSGELSPLNRELVENRANSRSVRSFFSYTDESHSDRFRFKKFDDANPDSYEFARYNDDPETLEFTKNKVAREISNSEVELLTQKIAQKVPPYQPEFDLVDFVMQWAANGDPLPFEIDRALEVKGLPNELRERLLDMKENAFYWKELRWKQI